MPDLTDSDFFVSVIGSFWERILVDKNFSEGIAATSSAEVVRAYQSLLQSIERLSIDTARPSILELYHPIIFKRSDFSNGPDRLKQGGGQLFGPQSPSGEFKNGFVFEYGGLEKRSENFYIGIDSSIVDIGDTIIDRLIDPTTTLVRGVDFVVGNRIITFKDDPFLNPLIKKRLVFSGASGEEEEIVLWASNTQVSSGEFEDQFGFISKGINPKSQNYFEITRSSLRAVSGGPSMSLVDHFIAALIGLPCIKSSGEVVQSVTQFRGFNLVATDTGIYKAHSFLEIRDEVVPGRILEAGFPLTKGSQIFDSRENPSWWSSLDGLVLSETFFNLNLGAAIGFPNKECQIELSEVEKSPDNEQWRSARFFIAGRQDDVDLFWAKARKESLLASKPLGNQLYKYLGITNSEGLADFSKPGIINPLEFVANNVFNSGAIVAKIQSSSLFSLEDFFRGSEILKKIVPAYLALIVIIDISMEDNVLFQRADGSGVEPIEIDEALTEDLLRGRTSQFPSAVAGIWEDVDANGDPLTVCPEAFSIDLSPDLSKETVSFGDNSENEVSYGSLTGVCEEFIESAQVSVCKP